jgi:1-acyl-sn-glycerol-3-phosphate acyltransferase
MAPSSPTYRAVRRFAHAVLRTVYRLDVDGAERVPAAGPLLVVANHESVLDPFVLGTAVPRQLRFLAKAELWRYAPVARAMDVLGAIPVERERGDVAALAAARVALEAGAAVAIFPQGRVRSTGPWLRGAARLALTTGAPLLPVRLLGTADALSRGRVGLPRLRVVVGTPITVERAPTTVATARELMARVQSAVGELG